jgi:hypothetical protein
VKQSIAPLHHANPVVSIKDISLDQFQSVFATKFACMGSDMLGFLGVVKVSNRTSNGVSVFQKVPYDVIADVSVDTRDEDALWCLIAHTSR